MLFVSLQGFVYGQPGPTLPDIRIITGVALGPASWFFTSFSFGYLFGCLITGFIEKKINLRLFLFICLFGTAVFTTVTPWCKYFELVLAARVCMGLFVGGIDTGTEVTYYSANLDTMLFGNKAITSQSLEKLTTKD